MPLVCSMASVSVVNLLPVTLNLCLVSLDLLLQFSDGFLVMGDLLLVVLLGFLLHLH